MSKPRITVDIAAKIEWPYPPKDMSETCMREHANMLAAAAGKRLEAVVQLLVAELLDVQTGG